MPAIPSSARRLPWVEDLDPDKRPSYTGDEQYYAELAKYEADPTNFIVQNMPGEIEVIVHTDGEKTPLSTFPTVKAALAAFEEFWASNRSRIRPTRHLYQDVVIEAPDWRRR
jgi:hypothetical protein